MEVYGIFGELEDDYFNGGRRSMAFYSIIPFYSESLIAHFQVDKYPQQALMALLQDDTDSYLLELLASAIIF